MKKSNYTYAIEKGNNILCYNTFSNAFIVVPRKTYAFFDTKNVEDFKTNYPNSYTAFVDNGIIIEDGIDELSIIRYSHKLDLFFDRNFVLTILPTIDCNLDCWYCFESHKKSQMSKDIQNRILLYIRKKYEKREIENLSIDFFGGEPLLYFDEVVYPLASQIKTIVEENGFKLSTFFTTNATLVTEQMAEKLAELNASFQITLDGDKTRHDKIRHYKKDYSGSYEDIINNTHLLFDKIPEAHFNIRINYDDQTLSSINNILEDLNDLDKKRFVIHFEKVWQVPIKKTNKLLVNALNIASANNFTVSFLNWKPCNCACKSDRLQQIAIQYDRCL